MSHESSAKEQPKNVLKRAFYMASGTLTSRILGLFRDIALGALFDRTVTDAWTAAFRIPNLFRRLLGEGSLSVSFIPVFMEEHAGDLSGARAKNLANGVYSVLLVGMGVLTLLGIVFIDPLFRLLLSDVYALSAEKWELTLRLGRIMFGFTFFVTLYAFYMGLLNALGSFGLPALAPALLNISMLVFTFMPPSWFPGQGDGLAWGVLVGGVLQAALLFVVLRARGFLPQWQGRMWTAKVKEVFKSLLPGVLGLGLLQLSTLVNLYFASSLPEGAISYIYWADRLLEFPLSLIAVSIGSALLPTLSQHTSRGEHTCFQETAEESFLMNLFLALPAALGLFFLAEPIVEVLFFRGRFSSEDLAQTAAVLRVYALSLVAISCSRVLVPLYYAKKLNLYPMILSLVCVVLHVMLAGFFIRQGGLLGLIYASLFAALVNAFMLFFGLFRWGLMFDPGRLWSSLWRISVASLALTATLSLHDTMEKALQFHFQRAAAISLFLSIILAMLVYFGAAQILGSKELKKFRRQAAP